MAAKMDVNKINAELYALYQEKIKELNGVCKSFPLLIKCPVNYCDSDNIRIMFIRLAPCRRFCKESGLRKMMNIKDLQNIYGNAVDNDFANVNICEDPSISLYDSEETLSWFNERNEIIRTLMKDVNYLFNKGKKHNYILTYIFKEIINIPADFIKLIDTLQYKNSVDILAKEISILKPHFIFFSNLDSISTLNDSPVNYTAKYDLLKDVFKMNITINDRGLNKYISVIEGDKKMDYLCFDLETYDSKLVYDFVSSLNVYNPMSQLKLYKNNNTSRLNNIKIFDFHSHKNTEINIVNNMLALVGENDVGKTSVLQALDMFFQKDEEMENHIKVEIDGKILSLESIKNKEINYFLFGSEIFSNSDIDRRTISELIDYKNENLANRNQSKRLKEQMYDILDIFKHIYDIYEFMELDIEIDKECGNLFHYSEEIKKIIDLFLEKRDLLVLFYGNENEIMENYKNIKESYPDDDADILQLKNSLDCLYKILKKFYFNENYFKSLHISSFGGTPPHLFEVLNDSSDMYFSKEILEDSNDEIPEDCSLFYELQDKVKQLYLHGFDKINVVDDIFLKIYGYDELLLKGSLNEIVDKTQEIKDNLDLYISRKLDNGIVDKWDELLNDFTSGDNVPIEKRGAGVRRLCSLFSYVVDAYRNMSVRQVPTIFAIDEVELSLHPNQQRQFIKVLNKLSEDFQFIITTHSPYVLSELKSENIQVLKKNEKGEVVPNPMSERVIKGYVSISEINYIAFGEPSIEYHIELYGYIQNKLNKNVSEVDEWLKNTCNVPARCKWFIVNKNRPQVHLTQDPCPRTLPYCVRNNIDHPLNDDATNPRQNRAYNNNKDYASLENIEKSIKIMREAIKRNNL